MTRLFCFLSIVLLSCDRQMNSGSNFINDSLERKIQFEEELSSVAYGPIKFGISSENYHSLYDEIINKSPCMPLIQVGECKYALSDNNYISKPYYYHDSLYQVLLLGSVLELQDYEVVLKKEWQNLKSVLNVKYGLANRSEGFIPYYTIDANSISFTDEWLFGNKKRIRLGISNYVGSVKTYYQVYCFITYLPLFDKMGAEEKDRKSEIFKQAAKDI